MVVTTLVSRSPLEGCHQSVLLRRLNPMRTAKTRGFLAIRHPARIQLEPASCFLIQVPDHICQTSMLRCVQRGLRRRDQFREPVAHRGHEQSAELKKPQDSAPPKRIGKIWDF